MQKFKQTDQFQIKADSMENRDLGRLLTEYEALQRQHIHIMKNENMPDLPAMIKQRDMAFSKIKQTLNDFIESSDPTETGALLPEEYQTRFESIIELSDTLSAITCHNRTRLKEDLKKMQQGKTAMKGYKNIIKNY